MRIGPHLLPYAVSRRAHGPGTPFPPTFLFILGFLIALWIDWQYPWPIEADPTRLDFTRAVVGVLSLGAGAAIFWWGMAALARVRTGILLQQPASRLVTAGPYQWTRNPQYVGYVVGYFGLTVLANTVWPLVLLPAVIVLLVIVVIAREERYLRGVFGPDYQDYCRRVNRWL
jgi:protein-S-isoprenylcysteine O-methyltransferase Ste14